MEGGAVSALEAVSAPDPGQVVAVVAAPTDLWVLTYHRCTEESRWSRHRVLALGVLQDGSIEPLIASADGPWLTRAADDLPHAILRTSSDIGVCSCRTEPLDGAAHDDPLWCDSCPGVINV